MADLFTTLPSLISKKVFDSDLVPLLLAANPQLTPQQIDAAFWAEVGGRRIHLLVPAAEKFLPENQAAWGFEPRFGSMAIATHMIPEVKRDTWQLILETLYYECVVHRAEIRPWAERLGLAAERVPPTVNLTAGHTGFGASGTINQSIGTINVTLAPAPATGTATADAPADKPRQSPEASASGRLEVPQAAAAGGAAASEAELPAAIKILVAAARKGKARFRDKSFERIVSSVLGIRKTPDASMYFSLLLSDVKSPEGRHDAEVLAQLERGEKLLSDWKAGKLKN
jgi:hypothetical protein